MKKNTVLTIIFVFFFLFSISSASAQEAVPGEFLVKFSDQTRSFISAKNTGINSIDELNNKFGVFKMEKSHNLSSGSFKGTEDVLYKVTYRADVPLQEVVASYMADSNVIYAEPNYLGTVSLLPDDSRYSDQSDLALVKAEEAWDLSSGNKSVLIAVVDTGVEINHPDLSSNIWINPGETAGNGIDDDGNGYIDDIHGWDFITAGSDEVGSGEDPGPPDNDPSDTYGHGTAVAGVIGAVGNNSEGVAGTSWSCQIMALKAGYVNSSNNAVLTVFDVSNAIRYAADNGAKIINMSFSFGGPSETLKGAVDYASSKGSFLVAAAGNEGGPVLYPAAYSSVCAVAATDKDDKKANFSCYGSEVDLCAPGILIATTYLNKGYTYMSGTSFSSPRVAGGAALLLSLDASLSSGELKQILCANTDNIDGLNSGFENALGAGRLNLEKALSSLSAVGEGESNLSFNLENTGQWVLISFPLEEISDLSGLKRPLYSYWEKSFKVIPPTGYGEIKPGYSYWTYVSEPSVINVTGKSISSSECSVSLYEGWNQIGNPFGEDMRMSSSSVTSQNAEALITDTLFLYDSINNLFNSTPFEECSLSPWGGGWLYSSGNCAVNLKK